MDIFDAIFEAYSNNEIEGTTTLESECFISIPDDPDLEEKVGAAIANAEYHGFINGLKAGLMLLAK